jgi:hypothetical protein
MPYRNVRLVVAYSWQSVSHTTEDAAIKKIEAAAGVFGNFTF